MDAQINTMKLTLKHYLSAFILLIMAITISAFLSSILLGKSSNNDGEVILFNLKVLDEKISDIEKIVKSNASKVTLKDRIDPNLVAEFGDDNAFLQKIAILKKQIVKRRLESEVIKLENEKVARDGTVSNADIYESGYKKNIASKIIEIMIINLSNGTAVMRVGENQITVKEGDNIKGFIVRKINPDSVVMGTKDGDDEILRLNYLSNKLYKGKKGDKNVKK